MITGVHNLMYSKKAEELRTFFREKLDLPFVDAGYGWQIFALPPAELGTHPIEGEGETRVEMYLMCDDIEGTLADLKAQGVEIAGPVQEQPWGLSSGIKLPDGSVLGIYEPRHATAIALK